MSELPNPPAEAASARFSLKTYSAAVPMGTLTVGVDNIHHDVFLSSRFVQFARNYLLDLIRQSSASTYFSGLDLRPSKLPQPGASPKLLSELMHAPLTLAEYEQ